MVYYSSDALQHQRTKKVCQRDRYTNPLTDPTAHNPPTHHVQQYSNPKSWLEPRTWAYKVGPLPLSQNPGGGG